VEQNVEVCSETREQVIAAGLSRITVIILTLGAAILVSGCSTDQVIVEQREAVALIDSVSALPAVPVYASDDLSRAKRSLAMADSLFALYQRELARMYYLEATIHARIAVVEAEAALLRVEFQKQRDTQ
jgi:hypothetical protein